MAPSLNNLIMWTLSIGFRASLSKPQRINPLHRIRRIRIQVQPARIADRVFADKASDLGIIVPMAIVVQPCFVILVLPLKLDRVGQALALCPFRALIYGKRSINPTFKAAI